MTVLAIDVSTRNLGWCADRHPLRPLDGSPAYGLILLPGMRDLPKLYAAVRNELCDLIEEFAPATLAWCRPMFRDQQSAAEALNGVASVAYLVCHDQGVRPLVEHEATVRKAILGRGAFGTRDAAGKLVKGSGSPRAKAAALAWCAAHGIKTDSDDIADAAVLHAYARRQLSADIGRLKRRAA